VSERRDDACETGSLVAARGCRLGWAGRGQHAVVDNDQRRVTDSKTDLLRQRALINSWPLAAANQNRSTLARHAIGEDVQPTWARWVDGPVRRHLDSQHAVIAHPSRLQPNQLVAHVHAVRREAKVHKRNSNFTRAFGKCHIEQQRGAIVCSLGEPSERRSRLVHVWRRQKFKAILGGILGCAIVAVRVGALQSESATGVRRIMLQGNIRQLRLVQKAGELQYYVQSVRSRRNLKLNAHL